MRRLRFLCAAAAMFAVSGCAQPEPKVVHRIAPAQEGYRLGCRLCYDETVRVGTGSPKSRRYKTLVRHRCAECMTDVVIYARDDGTPMIRCARCAPDGMPCDRCLPPLPSTTQPDAEGSRPRPRVFMALTVSSEWSPGASASCWDAGRSHGRPPRSQGRPGPPCTVRTQPSGTAPR